MKRIYMTLALVASLGTAAFAQKEVDLGIKLLSPIGQQTNLGAGDTLRISFEITNNGPDPIEQTDTMNVAIETMILGTDVHDKLPTIYNLGTPQMDIPAGGKDTLTWTVWNGQQILNDGTSIAIPTDAKICQKVAIWAFSADGYYFVDNGFDPQVFNQALQNGDLDAMWGAFSGNSLSEETVTYGSGATDLCALGMKDLSKGKVGLNVYPNPVYTNNVNLDFTTDDIAKNAQIRVTDVTGRVILTQEMGRINAGSHNLKIDVSGLSDGLYFIKLNADGLQGVTKFTIAK